MQDISEIKSHLGYQLRQVSNAVSYSFAAKLLSSNVTVAEWVVLREMYDNDNGTTPSMVANMTGLTRGAISKLIDRLLSKGLVSCVEVSYDRRYQEIKLTKEAKNLVPHLSRIADNNDNEFFAILTEDEKQVLKSILLKLSKTHKLTINPIK